MAVQRVIGAVEERMRSVRRLEKEEDRRRKKASDRSSLIKAEINRRGRGATKRAYEFEKQREKDRLVEDIIQSIVAGEPTGRFAATQPEIRNFAISEEEQVARPPGAPGRTRGEELAYIKPSHLKRLREKGVRRVSIEGGGISPDAKTLNTLRLLQDGKIPVDEGDPNELRGQLGRLGQPPPLSTDQAQEIMQTGRMPEQAQAGGQSMRAPIFTGGQQEDLRGLYGQFEPTPLEQPETDLTQWAQQYVGEPQEATPTANIQALYQQMQAEGGAKQKPAKLITVFKKDDKAVGPRTMRVPDVAGHPPPGYEFKEEKKGGTMSFTDAEEELKRRSRGGGGGGIGGGRGAPLAEGDERLTPPGPGATEEEWARYYWELARTRLKGASPSQIAAEARRLATQGGMQIG
jgi:hypothetical protein